MLSWIDQGWVDSCVREQTVLTDITVHLGTLIGRSMRRRHVFGADYYSQQQSE
jgi:hypothetical protein